MNSYEYEVKASPPNTSGHTVLFSAANKALSICRMGLLSKLEAKSSFQFVVKEGGIFGFIQDRLKTFCFPFTDAMNRM